MAQPPQQHLEPDWSDALIQRWGRRKLSALSDFARDTITDLNAPYLAAAQRAASAAHAPDTAWLIRLWCSPRDLGRRRGPRLPEKDIVLAAINRIENIYTSKTRTLPRRRIREAVEQMWLAHARRADDPRWEELESSRLFEAAQLEQWYHQVEEEASKLTVLPRFTDDEVFGAAVEMVRSWDSFLATRGHVGERFSLLEELTRLNDWPGDQWNTGDDFADAQARYHRRLAKARKRGADPHRDAIMLRGLFLREGLLTDPIDPLAWFLAAAAHLAAHPQVLLPWTRKDYNLLGEALDQWQEFRRHPRWGRRLPRPQQRYSAALPTVLDPRQLRAVSGPNQMIDVDEDVVAALPPGCSVRRLVLSDIDPLGSDWMVYWVRTPQGEGRPIMDLVESAKLRPQILWVCDGQPAKLAALVEPLLPRAFEIPTHPLAAYHR
ncbi:MAG: hypothetical protein Q4P06_02985 [Actinomycetaceae bacterium]|nr:hypothetical protein [Actinomycetaceae bacterium]